MPDLTHQTQTDPLPDVKAVVAFASAVALPGAADSPAIQPRAVVTANRHLNQVARPSFERPAQPFTLRRLQRTFGGFDHACRKQLAGNLPQQPLARVPDDFTLWRLAQRQFKQPVIEERFA